MQSFEILSAISALIWTCILLLPWKPYSTEESLDSEPVEDDLSDVTVLIPARNEAHMIKDTLLSVKDQGKGIKIILVDDQSDDGTAEVAEGLKIEGLKVIRGKELPSGWTGKIWALEQGFRHIKTPFLLLTDADISLKKGIVSTVKRKLVEEGWDVISLMAVLSMKSFWERILIPSFVYFFKMLYPFRLCNRKDSRIAGAAGGFVFLKTEVIKKIGGFSSIKGEIIDDCELAKRIKSSGFSIWLGLTHSVISRRRYGLSDIWNMVARSAFAQLKFSFLLLFLCSICLIASFVFPFLGFFSKYGTIFSVISFLEMFLTYIPTLDFYGIPKRWAISLPFSGILYLFMTWTSAIRYISGKRSSWKGRVYLREEKVK